MFKIPFRNRLVNGAASELGPTEIKLDISLEHVIDVPERLFYICHGCGKIFWDGSHGPRKLKMLKQVFEKKEENLE